MVHITSRFSFLGESILTNLNAQNLTSTHNICTFMKHCAPDKFGDRNIKLTVQYDMV